MAQIDNKSMEMGERTRQAIGKIYLNRLSVLKKGLNYSNNGDYRSAVENYHKYLNILSAYYEINEKDLSPSILKAEDLSELFLLSQVFWYMAKIYDRNPKMYRVFKKYLDQFVLFSKGQKFQYVNSEVLRKYISKGSANNSKDFIESYKLIKSKKGNCFIATYLYGENHPITHNLRGLRDFLVRSCTGQKLVNGYYLLSPILLVKVFNNPTFGRAMMVFLRPLVYLAHILWSIKSR